MAYEVINPNGKANIILVSEHASNHIPDKYEKLGLTDEQLQLHIAWDIGIGEVTRKVSNMLDAPAILANFSRLLIDVNRATTQQGLIPLVSDGHVIYGNKGLDQKAINERMDRFYFPFHDKTRQLISEKATQTEAPLIFNMHSFTPHFNGEKRIWHSGLLYNTDDRIARLLHRRLENRGYQVGDNEPYSGTELFHTMNTHALAKGLPHVNVEIRQNEIDHKKGVDQWSSMLAEEFMYLRKHPQLTERL